MAWREETIGSARLICADCREWLASVPPCFRVDAVITDPPYGVGLVRKTSDFRDSEHFDAGKSMQASVLYQDDAEHVEGLIRVAVPAALSVAQRALIFSGPRMLFTYPEPSAVGTVYTPNGAGRCSWGFQCSHPVLFYGRDPFLEDGKGSRPNSWRTEQPNLEAIDHPCPKPVPWMMWAVDRATRKNEVVLDPFMGSGTTGVACARLGRRFIGVEIEEKYFSIACRRIEEAYRQADLFIKQPEVA